MKSMITKTDREFARLFGGTGSSVRNMRDLLSIRNVEISRDKVFEMIEDNKFDSVRYFSSKKGTNMVEVSLNNTVKQYPISHIKRTVFYM